jgi:cobalt-zinc-cadmium efflux system membrane fusion protein
MTIQFPTALRLPLLCALLWLSPAAGCRANESVRDGATTEEHGQEQDAEREHGEDRLPLSAEQRRRFDIRFEEAGPGTIDMFVELPGEVRPNGDRLAHIVPRFPGIVREVRKTIGDSVRAGDVLAVIESSESLAPYPLTTAIDGTIIEKHLTRGEAIDREKGAFLVADLRNVWVDLSVYQKDLSHVGVGQRVRISAGEGMREAEGTIDYVTPTVDPPTRTTTARVVLSNPDGKWRPGMFVTARVLEPAAAPLVIPIAAVQTHEGRPAVFVDAGDGVVPKPLSLGRRGETQVEVLAGLAPGERFVATNSFLIKAELGKGAAEHGH